MPEVDLVGADTGPVAGSVAFVGTVTWHERQPVDEADVRRLTADAAAIPGVTPATPLVALTADDLLDAWSSG